MSTTLFVNLPVRDLERSKQFFSALGFEFFGMTEDMASVVINERTQVMLLSDATFAGHAQHRVLDAAAATEVILGLAQASAAEVDALADRAVAAGGSLVGEPVELDGRYQRGFADLDGHQWFGLCLTDRP